MSGLLIASSAIAFAMFLLFHSRLDIEARAHLGGGENTVSASLRLLGGAIWLRLEGEAHHDERGKLVTTLLLNDKPLELKHKKKKPGKGISLTTSARQLLVRHLDLKSLGFSLTLGIASDAAITAKLCGLALTVLESAAGIVRTLKPTARILMRSAPNYREDCLRARFSCIFGIKLGHIILIMACAIFQNTKGAFASWLTRLKTSCVPPWKTSRT